MTPMNGTKTVDLTSFPASSVATATGDGRPEVGLRRRSSGDGLLEEGQNGDNNISNEPFVRLSRRRSSGMASVQSSSRSLAKAASTKEMTPASTGYYDATQPQAVVVPDMTVEGEDESKSLPLSYSLSTHLKEVLAGIPGILMVLMFGYTYIAIVTAGNEDLKANAGFLLGWAQISNIAITLSAGLIGSTKWVIGGANTTSAILLSPMLRNANIETALIIQGVSSLFTALLFIVPAMYGGVGRLFGDRNPNTALYADYIHPSIIMGASHVTALLMIKYSMEIAVEGNTMEFKTEWWRSIFSPEALYVWIPAWVLGGTSAYLDLYLQKQAIAMIVLLVLPIIVFASVAAAIGLDNIPDNQYWTMTKGAESIQMLDFTQVDGAEVARQLPSAFIGALVITVEALVVYKSWSIVVPERRSVKHDSLSCGVAHLFIGCLGSMFGHQTFVESLVNYKVGFRWSYLANFVECAFFGGFVVLVFVFEPPPIPNILMAATSFYLACVFIAVWFVQRLPPATVAFEWMISSAVVLCCFIFGYGEGFAIGILFTSLWVYSTKTYQFIVSRVDYCKLSNSLAIYLHGHMSHGNTTEVFDIFLETSPKPEKVTLDLTTVSSADSAVILFFQSLSLMARLECTDITVIHSFPEDSQARVSIDAAAESSGRRMTCTFVSDSDVATSTAPTRPQYGRQLSLLDGSTTNNSNPLTGSRFLARSPFSTLEDEEE